MTINNILAHLQGRFHNGSEVIVTYPLLKNKYQSKENVHHNSGIYEWLINLLTS